ncbi:hypothetical protein BDR22DRAFT_196125 [Usnea florida]
MSPSAASDQSQIITNIAFGIAATFISIVTVWQGHRAWRLWYDHCCRQQSTFPDIELGLRPSAPAVTSLEESENGRSQSNLASGTPLLIAPDPVSAISHTSKDSKYLGVIPTLDLLATVPWERAPKSCGALPPLSRQSLASSRSEVELRMPPKPTLLRNSRSLEAVPHLSL